jgi:hypothetical protein
MSDYVMMNRSFFMKLLLPISNKLISEDVSIS